MKKCWLRVLVALLAAALLVSVLVQVYAYVEKQDCICAKLTTEEQEFEIDDRLRVFTKAWMSKPVCSLDLQARVATARVFN